MRSGLLVDGGRLEDAAAAWDEQRLRAGVDADAMSTAGYFARLLEKKVNRAAPLASLVLAALALIASCYDTEPMLLADSRGKYYLIKYIIHATLVR